MEKTTVNKKFISITENTNELEDAFSLANKLVQ